MLTFLIFIIILGLLIFIHEFGHFVVARWCRVKVEEFAFGFPPTIWKKEYKGTVYKINALPLGGYVKMLGEDKKLKDPHAFTSQPVRKRLAIIVAGVVMNLLLAYFILVIGYLIGMSPVTLDPATLGGKQTKQVVIVGVEDGSPAAAAGLRSSDMINGFSSADELVNYINANRGSTVALTVNRGQSSLQVDVGLRTDQKEAGLGVELGGQGVKVRLGLGGAIVAAAREIIGFAVLIVKFLWSIIATLFVHGKLAKEAQDVAGPVGIYTFTGQAVKLGFVYILQWIAILSLNFGLLNILPFPALDGGRAVFVALEGIVRRKVVRQEVESVIHMIGFVLLIALMIAITFREIIWMTNR